MAQLVACPECSKHLQVPDELLGKKVQCPECKHTFTAKIDEEATGKSTAVASTPKSKAPAKKPAWAKSDDDDESDNYATGRKKKRRRDDDDDQDEDDDDDDDRPRRRRRRSSSRGGGLVAHRGGMIMAFGLIALIGYLVFPLASIIFGPMAWIMGNTDLAEIRAGRMDPEGESQTQTGRVLGMIATIIGIIGLVVGCGFFVLWFFFVVLFVGAAANANKNMPRPPGQPPF